MITPRRTRLVRVPDLQAFRARHRWTLRRGRPRTAAVAHRPRADRRRGPPAPANDWAAEPMPTLATREEFYDVLHARLDSPPRRLTAYDRDVMVQSAARDASFPRVHPSVTLRRVEGRRLPAETRARGRDAAFLRSASPPGAERRAFRGAARRERCRGTRSTIAGRSECSRRHAFSPRRSAGTSVASRPSGACDEHGLRERLMRTSLIESDSRRRRDARRLDRGSERAVSGRLRVVDPVAWPRRRSTSWRPPACWSQDSISAFTNGCRASRKSKRRCAIRLQAD